MVNRVLRWMVRSFFAPVTGNRGAFASSLGFFLAYLPVFNLRILLLLVLSLFLRLNFIALFLGTLVPIFIPNIRHLPFLNLNFIEGDYLSPVLGGLIGLICYFFFHWFYNLGLKKEREIKNKFFLILLKDDGRLLKESLSVLFR